MTHTYNVKGMDCAHCAQTVEKGVLRLDGVNAARVDFATAQLSVEGEVDFGTLVGRVKALGYDLEAPNAKPATVAAKPGGVIGFWHYLLSANNTRLALIGGGILAVMALLGLFGVGGIGIELALIAATVIAGFPIAKSGLRALFINRDFTINLLMTIAGIGAILIGETLEAATVVFLFAVGEALEGYTADRARDSIRSLLSLAPPTANLIHDGHHHVVPIEQLSIGDHILVKAGDRIPMDGDVIGGHSDVNQAPITGESMPVAKTVGDTVYAGAINGAGTLTVRVTHLAADNTLSRIIGMVQAAQANRAPTQRIIDQFAAYYTPAVTLIALLIATVPPLLFAEPFLSTGSTQGWLYRALSLLVIACPCALVISAPVTVISGITAAARRGVLIKGGAYLEALGTVQAVAFDKTGTLTSGKPTVQTIRAADCTNADDCDQCADVLALAAAVEGQAAHPLADAVVHAAAARGIDHRYPAAQSVQALPGMGVRGNVGDHIVTVGSHRLFDEQYPHPDALCHEVAAAEAQGQTTMLLHDGDHVRGYITVADAVREDSRAAIAELKAAGLTIAMLTGDHPAAAHAIAAHVGVDDVRAGLMPADKVAAVEDLMAKYGSVAMVGDGINDTPALATATVGVAMGAAASPQALETADIALLADNVTQLPTAIRIAKQVRGLIRQNVALTLAVKALFFVLAFVGMTSLWLAIVADVGMSLLVTLNGMRPLRAGGGD